MKKTFPGTVSVSRCVPILMIVAFPVLLFGQPPDKTGGSVPKQEHAKKKDGKSPDSASQQAFRIDQPGTITFTVGMVIKGKVEKPQVIIFLPKEKTFYRDLKFTHSFTDEIKDPLPFTPVLE